MLFRRARPRPLLPQLVEAPISPVAPSGGTGGPQRETPASHRRARLSPFGWARTLRGRLLLGYIGVLVALLALLGLALNLALANALYNEEATAVETEALAAIQVNQADFNNQVLGVGSGALPNCGSAETVQQAFQERIADRLISSHLDMQHVYLVNGYGVALAQDSRSDLLGQTAPYLDRPKLAALQRQARVAKQSDLADKTSYKTTAADGQRVGVTLVAVRYVTASTCANPKRSRVLGFVEVVTTFPRTRTALADIRRLLVLSLGVALLAGALLGAPLIQQAMNPLLRMTRTTRRIAAGDLSQRVGLPHGGDEVGQLAGAFDEMVARIEVAFAAQQASEQRLRQFIADASHELRTPLTSLRGYTDVLLRGAKDDPETAEQALLAMRRESERMSRLVNDLLTLARLDAGRPLERQPVDLIALVGETVDQARMLAGAREVALRTDGGGRLTLTLDPDRIKQVALILLDNALKYGHPAPEGWVRVQVRRTPSGAEVSVADNGPGIAPEDLAHIFDRFYRAERAERQRRLTAPHATVHGRASASASASREVVARRSGPEGSGLGLAIAQAIAQAHGGALTVESQVGVGTVFTLRLPAG